VTAVDGKYQIGIYILRPIAEGEEITFDYNSVTEVSTIPSSLKLHIKLLYLMFM
jgi:SET domain-containing protein